MVEKFLFRIFFLKGCLHDSGLTFNPDRTHSGSAETIEDSNIFSVYMNIKTLACEVAIHPGLSSFRFSFRIRISINVDPEPCKHGTRFRSGMKSMT